MDNLILKKDKATGSWSSKPVLKDLFIQSSTNVRLTRKRARETLPHIEESTVKSIRLRDFEDKNRPLETHELIENDEHNAIKVETEIKTEDDEMITEQIENEALQIGTHILSQPNALFDDAYSATSSIELDFHDNIKEEIPEALPGPVDLEKSLEGEETVNYDPMLEENCSEIGEDDREHLNCSFSQSDSQKTVNIAELLSRLNSIDDADEAHEASDKMTSPNDEEEEELPNRFSSQETLHNRGQTSGLSFNLMSSGSGPTSSRMHRRKWSTQQPTSSNSLVNDGPCTTPKKPNYCFSCSILLKKVKWRSKKVIVNTAVPSDDEKNLIQRSTECTVHSLRI